MIDHYVSIMLGTSVSERTEIEYGCFLAAGSMMCPYKRIGNNVEAGTKLSIVRTM